MEYLAAHIRDTADIAAGYTPSKRAILLAINSEHGDRLVEITQEHTALARDLAVNKHLTDAEKESYKARIEQLRQERETILQQFEGR